MSFIKKILFGFIWMGLFWMGLFSGAIYSEELKLSVSVDRDVIPLNERLVYDVSISGAESNQLPNPVLPNLKGQFNIISSSESSSFSWMNGKVSVSKTKRYVLNPIQKGNFVIKPTTLTYKGTVYKSEPIRIQVVSPNSSIAVKSSQGSRSSRSGRRVADPFDQFFKQDPFAKRRAQQRKAVEDAVFIKAIVDQTSIYEGEQFRYALKLYRRVQLMSNLELGLPNFEGFGVEKLGRNANEKIEMVNGKRYYVMELANRLLYPLKSGNILIKPAEVGIMISLFDGRRILKTKPTVINVNSLPEKGRPVGFNGAVGHFNLSINNLSYDVTANTPLTMTVVLEGDGNLKSIQDLQVEESSNYKLYKSNITETVDDSGFIVNKKTFEYIFIPKIVGDFTLPGFKLDYFSTKDKIYEVVQTQPITVKVHPSNIKIDSQTIGIGSSIELLQDDLRYLKSVSLGRRHGYLIDHFFWLVLLGIACFFCLGNIGVFLKPFVFKQDMATVRRQKAVDMFIKQVTELDQKEIENDERISSLQQLYLEFLSNKTGTSFLGLTQDRMKIVLKEKGLDDQQISDVVTLLDQLAYESYAPSTNGDSQAKALSQSLVQFVQSLKTWS